MDDPYRLRRFVSAQDRGDVYRVAVAELTAGRKRGHWMWFVFPQVAGLGRSEMSDEFAISSLAEAQAYLRHPVLGGRLVECATILLGLEGRTASEILGSTDSMKLRSSMTLFMTAAPDRTAFRDVLDKYYRGSPDERTVVLLTA